jgi:hypothetical protein
MWFWSNFDLWDCGEGLPQSIWMHDRAESSQQTPLKSSSIYLTIIKASINGLAVDTPRWAIKELGCPKSNPACSWAPGEGGRITRDWWTCSASKRWHGRWNTKVENIQWPIPRGPSKRQCVIEHHSWQGQWANRSKINSKLFSVVWKTIRDETGCSFAKPRPWYSGFRGSWRQRLRVIKIVGVSFGWSRAGCTVRPRGSSVQPREQLKATP